jgi:hypothetical protein
MLADFISNLKAKDNKNERCKNFFLIKMRDYYIMFLLTFSKVTITYTNTNEV